MSLDALIPPRAWATARRLLLLGAALAALWTSAFWQRELNRERTRLGLTRLPPLENAPPVLAFTTVALGGFRGLIANALWMRADDLQLRGQYFEALQLADWITQLDPRNPTVWRYHAWNMAYNIAGSFSDPPDRWRWVERGIALLRDHALPANPASPELYTELGTYFQHKLGLDLDPAHRFYKQELAAAMVRLLGRSPNFAALAQPRTPDDAQRARELRDVWRLDPAFMAHVDAHYGPFDWRLPEAHAIYWADLGLERVKRGNLLPLRRVIWQSMLGAFRHGRLIENFADHQLDFGPNLALIGKVHDTFEEALAADPDRRDYIGRAHRNFHHEVVTMLYTHHRLAEAATWFQNLRDEYPDAVPPGVDLDTFVIERVTRLARGTTGDQLRGVIEGLLLTGYRSYALGEDETALGHVALARRIWDRHQARFAGQEQRAGLPAFEALQQGVLDRVLTGATPVSTALAGQLRERAGLPAPHHSDPPIPTSGTPRP